MNPTIRPSTRPLLGSAMIVLGAIGFSAKSILIKLAYADSAQVDAITLMTLRMLFALPFFLAEPCGMVRPRPPLAGAGIGWRC